MNIHSTMKSEWENVKKKKINHFCLSIIIIKEEIQLLLLRWRVNLGVESFS